MSWACYCVCIREDYEDGLHREFEIMTHSVVVWHVSEYSRHHVDTASKGQFHDEDAYVVCWHYAINQGETVRHCLLTLYSSVSDQSVALPSDE